MAKVIHCGGKHSNAKVYRLASSKPAYCFQYLQHGIKCNACGKEFMEWRGEYQEGDKFTSWLSVPLAEFDHWKRRIQAGEAKPEAQLMSEYSQRVARHADSIGPYLLKLTRAKQIYKGDKAQ